MSIEVRWINHASFRIAGKDDILYIDPWKIDGTPGDADVVFVSHSHYDHFSPDDIAKVSKENTAVVAPADVIEKLHDARSVEPEEQMTIRGITIETVAAYNVNKAFHPKGNAWCGGV